MTNINIALLVIAVLLGAISTEVMRRVALKLNVVDQPSSRKMQVSPIPYLGGVAVLMSFLGCFLVGEVFLKSSIKLNLSFLLVPFVLTFLIASLGLIDDIKTLNYKSKFAMQIITSIVTGLIISFSEFRAFSFTSNFVNIALTAFWLVFLMNSVNFFDNMDGLLSGTLIFALIAYLLHAAELEQTLLVLACVNLIGCLTGFIFFNFPNARIFLGDTGSLFLGFTLGLITIQVDFRSQTLLRSSILLILPISVIVFDTCLVVLFRILRSVHPASPGKDHLSHRLMLLGRSKRQAVLEIWCLTAVCSFASLILIRFSWLAIFLTITIFLRLLVVYLKTQKHFSVSLNLHRRR
jgi:UDP-GlcNAc:undecaprenyl-phosphate GlcNAc-1-phosphate transferase